MLLAVNRLLAQEFKEVYITLNEAHNDPIEITLYFD